MKEKTILWKKTMIWSMIEVRVKVEISVANINKFINTDLEANMKKFNN